jgi:hypothetical protein
MTVRKLSVSVPDWLEPIIREAASRDGVTLSEFMTAAAKDVIIRREADERRAHEQEHGIDRRAQLEEAEEDLLADRASRGQVAGAA